MRINLTSSEFADLVCSFLFDKTMNMDEVVADNDMFDEFVESMKSSGFKARLLHYYMNLSSDQRINYKRIKDVFRDGKNTSEDIHITSDKKTKTKPEKEGLARKALKIVKKLIKGESISIEEVEVLNEIINNNNIKE